MKDVCQIRVATPKDAARIAVLGANVWVHTYATEGVSDLIAQYVLTTFTPEKVLAGLNDSTVVLLVAEKEGNLAGYVVMRLGSYHAEIPTEIETLYIQDTFAGHGIGSALLHQARSIAMDRAGSQSIWLIVNSKNSKAISFYRSRGLTQEGIAYFELGGIKHENKVMVARD
ncbi:GNAT family N-acetyltransferase [Paraburkholderia tropica]|uniref:GNAT family N-acetyltransferase n=1 Tax=Paraburkholderia tropica TaxID=92647 RepID=UPI002AB6EEAD|nr:N-acetyltransferase [Paraburkholderia tropica]